MYVIAYLRSTINYIFFRYVLLRTCWSKDPQSRPDFSQLCFSLQGKETQPKLCTESDEGEYMDMTV